MKRYIAIFQLLAFITFPVWGQHSLADQPNKLSEVEKKEGWILLYDGSTSRGWRGLAREDVPAGWSFNKGVIRTVVGEERQAGAGGDLITQDRYANFELVFEWKLLTVGGNSGIKYYVDESMSGTSPSGLGLEYQILDDENHAWMLDGRMSPNDYHTLGALYEFFPPVAANKKMEPLGSWNRGRIITNGKQVEHWLNGMKVLEYERGGGLFLEMKAKSKFRDREKFGLVEKGHILLQDHGGEIQFRNLKIREL